MNKDEIITELVELVLMQEKEIKKLNATITRIKQYIEVYEDYIKGEQIQNGYKYSCETV